MVKDEKNGARTLIEEQAQEASVWQRELLNQLLFFIF